jgi:hypothetical protein
VPPRQRAAALNPMENSPARPSPSASRGASRSERDALLLELGALVYELHRKGQRAPELLQAKATALDHVSTGLEPAGALGLPCPHCFAAAEPGQLACLECGEPLGIGPPKRPRRRFGTSLIALAAVIALLGAAAAGFAASELTSDEDAASPAAAAEPASAAKKQAEPSGDVAGSSESGDAVALAAWPDDLSAYTVVLVTSSDEAGARKVAWDAARSGLEAGLLRSDDYAELGEGFWLVFAGHFKTPEAAERRAAELGARYEGAYPQQVVPQG